MTRWSPKPAKPPLRQDAQIGVVEQFINVGLGCLVHLGAQLLKSAPGGGQTTKDGIDLILHIIAGQELDPFSGQIRMLAVFENYIWRCVLNFRRRGYRRYDSRRLTTLLSWFKPLSSPFDLDQEKRYNRLDV